MRAVVKSNFSEDGVLISKIISRVKRNFIQRFFGNFTHVPRVYPLSQTHYQYRVGPGEQFVDVLLVLQDRKLVWTILG